MQKQYLLGRQKFGLYVYNSAIAKAPSSALDCLQRKHNHNKGLSLAANVQYVANMDKMWHLRLRHLPINILQILFLDIDEKVINSNRIWIIFPLARQTRSVHPKSLTKSTKPSLSKKVFKTFGIIAHRCVGALRHLTTKTSNMFIFVVDHFSKMSRIFLVKQKFEFVNVFKQFVTFMERQLEASVKFVKFVKTGATLEFYI